ncbi:cyanophycin synthetase [Fictibacillus aquaticus]|uniref:Cyanophycin synthetase n=1 Tax=Fictibacillus aquaticus TaxID=2021314 RepID=A0A235FDH1_9BACL|nr:cyanophycin synthetase [Fictibacillus aquaticus]OYD59450.1 cyanophycin synthetase [Fictibacillus aquaticus]
MKINRVNYLSGPNLHSFKPTIWIELDIEDLEEKPSSAIPGFTDTLLSIIPSLHTHTCSRGYPGGFVERLHEGTWMGHILEHIALEIQHLAGIKVKRGKTITSKQKGIYFVTYDYREPKSGYYAFEAAMEIVTAILNGDTIYAAPYIEKTSQLYHEYKLGPSTEAVYEAALARKIPVERVGTDSFLRIGTGSKQKYVQATISSQTSYMAVENACDKDMTKQLLAGAGIPVPAGEVITTEQELVDAGMRLGFPLVIKPLNGRQGKDIVTNIRDEAELLNAFHCVYSEGVSYIIERYYEGNDYRFFVVDGKLVAASLRLPPMVIGDGVRTIAELIEEENMNPLRGDGHEKAMTKIPLDERTACHLELSGFSLHTVLKEGQRIDVLGNANLSTGGSAIDVTDIVHRTYRDIAVSAAHAVGLDIAGIDLISNDVSAPYKAGSGAVLEVNAAPGIRMHLYPSAGEARDAGGAIVDYLFSSREEAAIPVVAVTGTNGKTTVTRLTAHLLQKEGLNIGMTNSDGVWLNDNQIDSGDCSGPKSARKVLSHPSTDIAVLETARGGLLREGLAFRYCDVGIVTNVSEDHLGQNGIETLEDLQKLKRTIPEVVLSEGHCVLNADDLGCAAMAEHTEGKIIYFSLYEDNPLIIDAIENGDTVWYVKDDWVMMAELGKVVRFLPVSHIPITIGGAARHNIANSLAALAAAHSLGRSLAELRSKIITFQPSMEQSRGRFNMEHANGRTVIIDYAHNPAGMNAIFETIASLPKNRIIVAASAAGDRPDDTIFQMGRIIGESADVFIAKQDRTLRGRKSGESIRLLQDGALSSGRDLELYALMSEKDAFEQAVTLSEPGDLLLFFYDDFSLAEEAVENLKYPYSQTAALITP